MAKRHRPPLPEPVLPAPGSLAGATIEEVWAYAPEVECKGLCADACGPIGMAPVERRRIEARGVKIPPLREAIAIQDASPNRSWRCPALVDGRCSIYEDRPMICRLLGAVARTLECPYGCHPKHHRMLTPQEGRELLRASRTPRVR